MPWPGPGMGGCMVVNSAGGECGLILTWDEWGGGIWPVLFVVSDVQPNFYGNWTRRPG